jgi:hypothetical protein
VSGYRSVATRLKDVDAEGIKGGDGDIDAQVELFPVDEVGLAEVPLYDGGYA